MDRNTIIGLVLIVGIVITWTTFFGPDTEQEIKPKQTTTQPSDTTKSGITAITDSAGNSSPTSDPIAFLPVGMDDSTFSELSDSAKTGFLQDAKLREKYGHFAPLAEGEDKVIHVVTDKLEFDLHTKGGIIRPLIMKDFRTFDSLPLPLVSEAMTNYMSLYFPHRPSKSVLLDVWSKDLYLTPNIGESTVTLTGDQTKEISLRGSLGDGRYFELAYNLRGDSYEYGMEVRMSGLDDIVQSSAYDLVWSMEIPKTEKAMAAQRQKTAIYYRAGGDVESLSTTDTGPIQEDLSSTSVDWVAFKSQFFSQTLMSIDEGKPLTDLTLNQALPIPPIADDPESGEVVKMMAMTAHQTMEYEQVSTHAFRIINTPLEYETLQGFERDMTRQIDLGWGPLKYINMYLVIPVFNFLEGTVGNYGLIILILALLIKLLLYPLTFKTYTSTAKMRVINKTPEIKELEEKYKDNSTKLQQEKMSIYRSMGVNVLGGCLPMLLQYPFLISLFFLFPNLIELRQQGFLWATDLSTYDSVMELGFKIPFYGDHVSLFTLLMTVSIYIYTMINQKMQGTTQSNPVMKYFPYIMPVIFLGFLNNYSAGLSWYYLVSNLISITQAQVSKYFINEEKLLEQMRNNAKKKKSGKKGKGRLEKWSERQQQKQKQISAQRQKGSNNGSNRNNRRGK